MPKVTYPNQKCVTIHREPAKSDFLGIKNANWQLAACDLRPHAFLLYLYFAANADNYEMAFSPEAVYQAVGMPRSTARDQMRVLIAKGYLVERSSNHYDFYEVPLARAASFSNNSNTSTAANSQRPVNCIQSEGREINNSNFTNNCLEAPNEPPKETDFDEEDFNRFMRTHRNIEDILRATPGYMGEFETDNAPIAKPGKFEF